MSEAQQKRLTCRCRCGYTCGGPGRCELGILDCLKADHWVRDCDHDFTGEAIDIDGGWSVTCKHCGMTAMSHDMMVGP